MRTPQRGSLRTPLDAPETGESNEVIARLGGASIEQILSGTLEGPVDYDPAHDEWVLVLSGAAVVEIGGTRLDLTSGDWVLLPAGLPHRLVDTEPGTSWLAVHAPG